jgi:MFS family permease
LCNRWPAILLIRLTLQRLCFGGLLLAALAIIAVTFAARIPLIVVVIIAGIGIGTVWTNSDALVSTLVNRGQLGASIGAAQSFKEFGDMVGPLLVGAIMQWFSARMGFVNCGAVALACLVLANFAAASPRGKIEVADL